MYRDYRARLITELHYKTFNNRVDALTRRTKKEYYRNIFANFKSNTAKLWKTINNLTKPPQSKQKVSNIIYEDKILTNAKDISNAFNNFFTTIGTKLESQQPHALCDPMQYLLGDFPNLMTKPRITINGIL